MMVLRLISGGIVKKWGDYKEIHVQAMGDFGIF